MKIISWNVNGLRACVEKDFVRSIAALDADIICVQETKATQKQVTLHIEGYTQYWHSSRRSGYSGVLVLTRVAPISVQNGFGTDKFDIEGRSITLEFEKFFLVTVYMPLSKSRLQRAEYRREWDDSLLNYLKGLSKPVILCGDFNVAHHYIDIYEENLYNEANPSGFVSSERSNMDRLLSCGYIDAYRYQNPSTRQYTWWSNRGKKREQNRGWRLDYFLVHSALYSKVIDVKILDWILGSDHCPISLEIDLYVSPDLIENDLRMAQKWEAIDWPSYENQLFILQKELAIATAERNRTLAYEIQNKILRSFVAKALAVRHVSETQTEAGIDGIKWVSSAEKMKATLSLEEYDFTPSPTKSVFIYDGRKERKINIPTYYDRAICTLMKYALEPVAETTADRKSFGFRHGRSAFDAMTYTKMTLEQCPNLWVLRGDIKSYYDTISHDWIFRHLPMRQNIKKLLKVGAMLNGELFPTDIGISLGNGLSPIIGNMVLDRLQTCIFHALYSEARIENYAYGDLIRFADDFIVYAKSYEQAVQIKDCISKFLVERGLRFSPEKTYIVPASKGFDFLGWHFQQIGKAALVVPSEQSVRSFEIKMEQKILQHTGSVEDLIHALNRSIQGYANYHRVTEARDVFHHLDVVIQALLVKKIKKLHPRRPWEQLKKIYWFKNDKGEYIFTAPDQRNLSVVQMKHIPLCFHFGVKTDFNYFLDTDYLKQLDEQRKIDRHTGKYKKIWTAQDGKCYICGCAMLPDQFLRVVNYPKVGEVYIHSRCKNNLLEYRCEETWSHGIDVTALMRDEILQAPTIDDNQFIGLREFFCKESRQVFTLPFTEIEGILGDELPASALGTAFWYDCHCGAMAHCWLQNGYIIQRLDIKNKKVIFRKDDHSLTCLKIPKALTCKKIPKNAQDEMDAFFRYIVQKYKL